MSTSTIVSALDYDEQLWVTWSSPRDRVAGRAAIDRAWAAAGGTRGTLHLVRSDDDYDYQDDCMNDASA